MVTENPIVKFLPGEEVIYRGKTYYIRYAIDLSNILLASVDDGTLVVAQINEISPSGILETKKQVKDVSQYTSKEWEDAQRRFAIIQPIIKGKLSTEEVRNIAKQNRVNMATLYRWIAKFNQTGTVSSLVSEKKGPPRGFSKLSPEVEAIVDKAIEEVYLTKQRNPVFRAYATIIIQCKNSGLKAPHINTVRNKILRISEEKKIRLRIGKDVADNKYNPIRGEFPGADYPLSVVQIDHTKLDIILVDEVRRKPLGRPWITLSIDVFSRMALGFYISFDPPGAMGTGMCVSNSILPKDSLISKFNVKGEWPCWGVMKKIHLDNAKEFRGDMLARACEEYGIGLEFRPVKKPNYGGHIESLMGTFSEKIHSLPGTTFSNPNKKGKYDSEGRAVMTLSEFEEWFTVLVVEYYHNKVHDSLGVSPLEKYKEGIFGSPNQVGIGLSPRYFNDRKLKLDFMPFEERTIQPYGVRIGFIYYYHDVLRKYIHSYEDASRKNRIKRKFIFKIDPRDIGVIFFYDPDLEEYYQIPYRNLSFPSMTIWEYREVVRKLKHEGVKVNNEDIIFNAYNRLIELENASIRKTKEVRAIQKKREKKRHSLEKSLRREFSKEVKNTPTETKGRFDTSKIKPFDDLQDEPFK